MNIDKIEVIKYLLSSEFVAFYIIFLVFTTTIIYLTYRFWDMLIGRRK